MAESKNLVVMPVSTGKLKFALKVLDYRKHPEKLRVIEEELLRRAA